MQEGNTNISVCVTKKGQTELTIVVTLFTWELSATSMSSCFFEGYYVVMWYNTSGDDFMEVNAQLQFNPEDNESCVQIAILSDNFSERPEVFQMFLIFSDPSSAAEINTSMLTVVINDESYVGQANTHN